MRATSKRLCFIASMALSNRTLSGCLELTLARGFLDFLLVQADVMSSSTPNNAIKEFRRNIGPRINLWDRALDPVLHEKATLSTSWLRWPLSTGFQHSFLDRRYRIRRCLQLEFLLPPAPHRQPCREKLRHRLLCGKRGRAGCESQITDA